MPDVLTQAKEIPPPARSPLLIRWLLKRGDKYEDARDRWEPFDRLVSEDTATRDGIARLVATADTHGVPCIALVDNKAEGSAPESVVRLARAIVQHSKALRPAP
jgi:hypothetical protein